MIALNENERQELTRLRTEVQELREIIKEYERPDRNERQRTLAANLRSSLQVRPNGALILADMILTAPRFRTREAIMANRINVNREDGACRRHADVEIWNIRKQLKAKQLPVPGNMREGGWFLTKTDARTIREFAERHA